MSYYRQLLILIALISSPLLLSFEPLLVEKSFMITGDSDLYLNGSSNINEFSCVCLCYEKNQQHRFQMSGSSGKWDMKFHHTSLDLRTNELDCGHRGINKDLYKTLNSEEHPHITIELLRVDVPEQLDEHPGWSRLTALTAITIAGVRREVEMSVRGQRIDSENFRFVGEKDLYMSNFNLEPPKPLFGLIKVHDLIQIYLDLSVRVQEPG